MPPRGNQIGQTGHPINELWARTNENKGKDGQGLVTAKDGQGGVTGKDGQGWVMGKGKDRQGQQWAGTIGAGCQLVRVSPRLGCPDEKGASTI